MRPPAWLTRQRVEHGAWAGTAVFVVTAFAAMIAPSVFELPALAVSVGLFVIGCWAFLVAFFVAVERSRFEELSVVGIYFMSGSAPTLVRRSLLGATAVQIAVALLTAGVRPFTSLAFGILVPMFGLGLAGLWAASFGTFPERGRPSPQRKVSGESPGRGNGRNPSNRSRSRRDG